MNIVEAILQNTDLDKLPGFKSLFDRSRILGSQRLFSNLKYRILLRSQALQISSVYSSSIFPNHYHYNSIIQLREYHSY